jgi:hypothetical protein
MGTEGFALGAGAVVAVVVFQASHLTDGVGALTRRRDLHWRREMNAQTHSGARSAPS